jgi:hypothetical protein
MISLKSNVEQANTVNASSNINTSHVNRNVQAKVPLLWAGWVSILISIVPPGK